MMKVNKRPDRTLMLASIAAATQTLTGWVLAAAAVFVGVFETYLPRGVRIEMRGFVRDAASDVRHLVVMCATVHWKGRGGRRVWTTRPGSTPPGFRRRPLRGSNMRRLKRAVQLRGRSVAQRIAGLRGILASMKTWTTRMHARMDALMSRPRLRAVRPPADVRGALSAPACACADTS